MPCIGPYSGSHTARLTPYDIDGKENKHKSKLFVFGLLVGYIFSATGVDSTVCTSCVHTEQELTGSPLCLAAKAKCC